MMVKFVLNDYWQSLCLKNVKKEHLSYAVIYIYGIAMIYNIAEVHYGVFLYCYMISALLGIALSYLCGRKKHKIFYLLPITKKDRIQYATVGFKIKNVIPATIYFVWAGVLALFQYIQFRDFLIGLLLLVLCNMAVQTAAMQSQDTLGIFQILVRFIMFGGFFFYYVLFEERELGQINSQGTTVLFMIWYVIHIMFVPIIIKYTIRHYKNMIRRAADYEYKN